MWTNYLRDVLTRLSLMKRQIFWTYVATQLLPLIQTKLSRRSRREKELKLRRTKGTRKSTLEAPYPICLSFFQKFLKVDKYRYIYDIRYKLLRQPNLRNTTPGFLSTQPTQTAQSVEMSYLTSPTSFSWSTASRVRTEFRFGVFSNFVKIWNSYQLIFSKGKHHSGSHSKGTRESNPHWLPLRVRQWYKFWWPDRKCWLQI